MNNVLDEQEAANDDAEWQNAVASAPPVKSAGTRLLDMLAGWGNLASTDTFPDHPDAVARIGDLYQEAGQFAFDNVDADEMRIRIQEFLISRVLPTLTR